MKTTFLLSLALSASAVWAQTPIKFVDPIPEKYEPDLQIPQFIDVCPDVTLPKGHVYYKPPTKQGWTIKQNMAKGVTHWERHDDREDPEGGTEAFSKNPAYAKKEYTGVPRIREIFGLPGPVGDKWWPNGFFNEKEAREKGKAASIRPRLWIGETMEGADWVPSDQPMWGWFYDELIKRYEAQKALDGVPYYVAHNYFAQFPGNLQNPRDKKEFNEFFYDNPPEKWPKSIYSDDKAVGKTNTILEGIYINTPDFTQQQLLNAVMKMEIIRKMGKYTGLFVFNVHEWYPGFASRIEYPEGILYRKDKTPLDPNLQISLAFLAHEYGSIFVEWGLMGYQPPSRKPVDYYAQTHKTSDTWYRKGATKPSDDFPFYTSSLPNRYNIMPYLGDMTHFGIVLWSQTGAQVEGGTPAYATYKIDGKEWIPPQKNGSDIVASYYEKRGVVRTRTRGKKMLICYFNMFADNEKHALVVQNPLDPTETFVGTVCGNGVHAVVVNLK